jgi:hypothetical protein
MPRASSNCAHRGSGNTARIDGGGRGGSDRSARPLATAPAAPRQVQRELKMSKICKTSSTRQPEDFADDRRDGGI